MEIKICGIRRAEDVELINTHKPDYIGFIFYPPSPRFISFEEAREIKKKLDPNIKTVGVFVDEDPELILEEYRKNTFDLVQLHGDEDQQVIDFFKSHSIPVIKAIKIKDQDSISKTDQYEPDFFLFDIYDKKKVGGTGEAFNWELLKHYNGEAPFFLAGGINHSNLKTAVEYGPDILDISSGVETDYKKDPEKLKILFEKFNKIDERK